MTAASDNTRANVVGLALGTLFRWWNYRRWVFPAPAPQALVEPEGLLQPEALPGPLAEGDALPDAA